jgi:hypothetical protein
MDFIEIKNLKDLETALNVAIFQAVIEKHPEAQPLVDLARKMLAALAVYEGTFDAFTHEVCWSTTPHGTPERDTRKIGYAKIEEPAQDSGYVELVRVRFTLEVEPGETRQ